MTERVKNNNDNQVLFSGTEQQGPAQRVCRQEMSIMFAAKSAVVNKRRVELYRGGVWLNMKQVWLYLCFSSSALFNLINFSLHLLLFMYCL